MPESSRTERSFRNSFSSPGLISMKPGLAASVASLASREELARPADTGILTSREMRSQISLHVFFRRRVAPDHVVHRGEIQKAFVNRDRHQRWRILLQHAKHLRRNAPVFVVMRTAQHAARTKPLRLETRHAGLDAEFFRRAIRGDDDAVAAPAAADPHGPALQFWIRARFRNWRKNCRRPRAKFGWAFSCSRANLI